MTARAAADVSIVDVPERSRFEVRVAGELAGFAEYRRTPTMIAFTHTQIDPRFEGQGLAGRLARTALEETRAAELAVMPFCGFIRGYIDRNSADYLDLVPQAMRRNFGLPSHA